MSAEPAPYAARGVTPVKHGTRHGVPVYVVRAGKAMRVPVKLGYADGEFVEVREGLKLGEQVVTAGKTALREGSSVQVIDPATPPTAAPAPVAAAKK